MKDIHSFLNELSCITVVTDLKVATVKQIQKYVDKRTMYLIDRELTMILLDTSFNSMAPHIKQSCLNDKIV